eukprot:590904-Pyramimonas_sp.AAC.1
MGSSVDHMLHKQRKAADAWESSPYGDMYGGGARHTAVLLRDDMVGHPFRPVSFIRDASALVTGGLGSLGALVGLWL